MLNSAAWRSLSLPARCLLLEVWQRYNGANNGEISYSVREAAERLRVGQNTPTKLFRELEDKGFLKAHERGAFTRKNRMATIWILTGEEYDGQPATKDFMRWPPVPEIQNTVTPRVTNSPSQGDRGTKRDPLKAPHSHSQSDHRPPITQSHGHPQSDTSSIPGRGSAKRRSERSRQVERSERRREAVAVLTP